MERRTPIKVEEAIEYLLKYKKKGAVETVEIEKASGRFLGENLFADHDVPLFDRSPYDGFAIRAEDTTYASKENPVSMEVVSEIGAGSVYNQPIKENQAVRIMTGAPIPEGASAVVMLELVKNHEENGRAYITINRPYKEGDNISFRGEDTKKGTILAEKGTYINPGIVALLATFGYKEVPVSRKPKVGVLATGSELLEIDEPLVPGKIRNSNSYMVLSQIERAGGEGIFLGQLSDDFDLCFGHVENALQQVDFLITTGGVSVGDYDYLPAIYKKLGANVLFNKVGMRPGSVTTVAEKDGKLLFGLSGNPSACYVGFELFVRPVIRFYLQCPHLFVRREEAVLGKDFPKPNPFTRFVRGEMTYSGGSVFASPTGLDKSGVVSSLASANVLIVLPSGTRGYEEGMRVHVLLLEDQQGSDLTGYYFQKNESSEERMQLRE
ncbi:molybdopterin molybdenumtransferase [Rossellomorea vietnamensis]|uniref:Molybdopterin molybdenumtransferase n=1 Tax=Rossellomorea vietnamensis TaxID=218284 RepID=A0A0P6WNY2_9BACI|nr:molybdopterin molybdenumtransferase [Rossellomorea vietnamensis]